MITAILVSILVSALGWLALSYQRLLRKEAAVRWLPSVALLSPDCALVSMDVGVGRVKDHPSWVQGQACYDHRGEFVRHFCFDLGFDVFATWCGSRGVGFAAAVELAKANIPVTLACRNPSRAANARKKILEKVPAATVDILIVDVSDPLSVTQALEKMKTEYVGDCCI